MVVAIKPMERAYIALQTLGYKILLKNYECPLGGIDFVAKRAGELIFISINPSADESASAAKAGLYYVKRYGLDSVVSRHESYEVV